MFPYRVRHLVALAVLAVLAMAADPPWQSKEINLWNREDAIQVLADSPWAKTSAAIVVRLQTEDERRESGQMGQSTGLGYDGVDAPGSKPALTATLRGAKDPRRSAQPIFLNVRWETATPIRVAEIKAGVVDSPTLDGEGYQIAIYGIPGGNFKGDPKSLGLPLRKTASLRREGKRDVAPSLVEVLQRETGVVVVYLFPITAEISPRDGVVEFSAQIGRIVVSDQFHLDQMVFHGKLEL